MPPSVIEKWPSASGMNGLHTTLQMRFSPLPFFKYSRVVDACASTAVRVSAERAAHTVRRAVR